MTKPPTSVEMIRAIASRAKVTGLLAKRALHARSEVIANGIEHGVVVPGIGGVRIAVEHRPFDITLQRRSNAGKMIRFKGSKTLLFRFAIQAQQLAGTAGKCLEGAADTALAFDEDADPKLILRPRTTEAAAPFCKWNTQRVVGEIAERTGLDMDTVKQVLAAQSDSIYASAGREAPVTGIGTVRCVTDRDKRRGLPAG